MPSLQLIAVGALLCQIVQLAGRIFHNTHCEQTGQAAPCAADCAELKCQGLSIVSGCWDNRLPLGPAGH